MVWELREAENEGLESSFHRRRRRSHSPLSTQQQSIPFSVILLRRRAQRLRQIQRHRRSALRVWQEGQAGTGKVERERREREREKAKQKRIRRAIALSLFPTTFFRPRRHRPLSLSLSFKKPTTKSTKTKTAPPQQGLGAHPLLDAPPR